MEYIIKLVIKKWEIALSIFIVYSIAYHNSNIWIPKAIIIFCVLYLLIDWTMEILFDKVIIYNKEFPVGLFFIGGVIFMIILGYQIFSDTHFVQGLMDNRDYKYWLDSITSNYIFIYLSIFALITKKIYILNERSIKIASHDYYQ